MFRGKLKFIICIALVAAIIGAAAGVAVSQISVTYDGDVEFYISPGDNAHKLLPLLQSDSFAEKLLLDEYGLPLDADKNSLEYTEAKEAVIAANEARKHKQELVKEYEKLPYELAIVEDNYKKLSQKYNSIFEELSIYKNAEAGNGLESLDPTHKAKVAELEAELEAAKNERDEYSANEYFPIVQKKLKMEQDIDSADIDLKEKREEAEEKAEKLLASWRENEEIKEKISVIRKSVKYEYAKILDDKSGSADVNNLNQAFLVVSLSISNNRELANEILTAIKEKLPDYAEKNIEIITDTDDAECKIVSTFASIESSASSNTVSNAVTYAAIAALLAVLAYIFAVVIKNMLGNTISAENVPSQKNSGSEQ